MNDPRVILLVTWDGGGNVPPMLAPGRRLARRGHEVRVLGTPSLGDRVVHAGLDFAAFARGPELDRTGGTAIEDQVDAFVGQLAGPELSADVADALEHDGRTARTVVGALRPGARGDPPRFRRRPEPASCESSLRRADPRS